MLKTLSGATPPAGTTFDFELRTGVSDSAVGTTEASCTTDVTGYCDFGGTVFMPGDYWFCEVNMMPGWSTSLTGYPGAIVPNNTDPGVDNSVICAPFALDVGETESFSVDNTPPPGGDARTIGFWKNWTSCDGNGNQDAVLDDNLPAPLGSMDIIDCPVAVDLLDKRDIKNPAVVKDGKKMAGDAAYGLAAQLLAYELNQNANAGTCSDAVDAAASGHALLTDIGFDGTGGYLKGQSPSVRQDKADASMYAGLLDSYNNNELCIVP
ncbi:MAG: hypothetical protein KJO91_12065 [Gammaproteobacteria bacterium]|nr:hypothetical protein [Gammaproteobacteria bacterium]